jgi:hypothetical protein
MNKPETTPPEAPTRIECRYTWLVRWLIPFGILFFVGLGGLLLHFGVSTPQRPVPVFLRGFIALLGVGSVYLAFLGVRLLPFRSAQVVADDAGLRVTTPRSDRFYSWRDISRVNDNSILQIPDVYSAAGTRILSVDYVISRFPLLRERIFQNLTRDAS